MKLLTLTAVAALAIALGYIVHLNGRIAELEGRVAGTAAQPADAAPAAAAPAVAAAPQSSGSTRALSEDQRAIMIQTLSDAGLNIGSPVWFTTVPNDPEAASFQKSLASVFTDAGWIVKREDTVGFAMKPGIFIFAADEFPPAFVGTVNDAFTAAGIELTGNGRGYRAYQNERRAENPNWVGFDLADDQSFIIAIGRAPAS